MTELTPREIVRELDRYIIGQDDAKRAVAVALRNRYRRAQLPEDIREEVTPKNILMIGPTGVGKTEIARRLAKLVDAPFIKVEATKFTEVGYVGRDVESIVRDLVEAAIRLVKEQHGRQVRGRARAQAEDRLVELLSGATKKRKSANPIDILLGNRPKEPELSPEDRDKLVVQQDDVRTRLRAGQMEHEIVEIEVEEVRPMSEIPGMDVNMNDMLSGIIPKKTKLRKVEVREARKILEAEEEDNLIDMDQVYTEAIDRAEQHGIVFLDEIDKVAGRGGGSGPDVSREGVQRDILPIVEGSTVNTKYGPVKTDHMLFIAAGAFHVAKVTDLIPELQGRFPVRVDLKPLSVEDYKRILTQPENALIRQYELLLGVDGVSLDFTDAALSAIAECAWQDNETGENIGARRLHTLLEQILMDIAFNAGGGDAPEVTVTVDKEYVEKMLGADLHRKDVRKYIL
ncbi:MAG: ATP-dependent protease ATPase subunit HslU [Clostridiales bacterium]|nr:ATP-dependent protease ATPase subunit HslU [Clostridiales bacterium]